MYPHARRLVSVLLVGATAASTGCVSGAPGDPSGTPEARPIPFQPLQEAQTVRFYSGLTTRQRLVIRDAATWANVWRELTSPFQPAPPVPAVDFASNLVVVAAMGLRNTGGYSITIDDVRTAAGDVSISVTERSPGSGCIVTAVVTEPVAVVVASRFAGQATFVEHTALRDCQ